MIPEKGKMLHLEKIRGLRIVELHNEKLLLLKIIKGNEQAFKEIYDHYYQQIFNKALHLVKDSVLAEDVVQEVFVKIWVNRKTLATIHNFGAYLNIILRNHIYNFFRKQAHHENVISQLCYSRETKSQDIPESVTLNELLLRVNQAVSTLPPQQKRVYELCHSDGLKQKEIAAQLNISRETVKKHLSEAMKKIRHQLKEFRQNIILFLFSFKN